MLDLFTEWGEEGGGDTACQSALAIPVQGSTLEKPSHTQERHGCKDPRCRTALTSETTSNRVGTGAIVSCVRTVGHGSRVTWERLPQRLGQTLDTSVLFQ